MTLNINIGHNQELLEQCRALKEYAQYVNRVRKYVGKMNLDAAVHRAVEECIREGILEDFLRVNRSEVEKVSIFEYDKEEEERKLREAEREVGREQKAHEVANILWKEGIGIEKIAKIVDMEEAVIRKWITH